MTYHILIVTEDDNDATILNDVFSNARNESFSLTWEKTLSSSIERLLTQEVDAVIVDLTLPDSKGITTFDQLLNIAPHTPIMTLISSQDDRLINKALVRGAQGYLIKNSFNIELVPQTIRNLIRQKEADKEYLTEKNRAEIALNSIGDSVLCTNLLGEVEYLNIAAETLTGWTRDEAKGKPINEVFKLINSITRQHIPNPVTKVIQENKAIGLRPDTVMVRRDEVEIEIEDSISPIHDWDGRLTGVVIVFHDVTEMKRMSKKMAFSAQHDYLTNLPNRMLLNDRMSQAISLAKRYGTQLALLFLDLDNFKHINDSLGHEMGDKLLQSVAVRLTDSVRSSDTVSRQGGDEFVIILNDPNGKNAARTAEKILTELALKHHISNIDLHITTSIGISVYPADGLNAATLIKHADTAMYFAKEKGKNTYQYFNKSMNARAVERQLIEASLRRAIHKKELILHYQPKINLQTGVITGAEALLRWVNTDGVTMLPARFISIAEESGLIIPIGRWVLRESCFQAQQWIKNGLGPISISVNISALEFNRHDFFDGIQKILAETGLDPKYLELEITESVMMLDVKKSEKILKALQIMGVQLAVDDFGTGYSSLSYLLHFPINVLKIDQSFVGNITSPKDEGVIVSAIIGMGNNLKLRVIAEGIENKTQLDFLKSKNCNEGQGFYFSRPVSANTFTRLLTQGISPKVLAS